MNIIIRESKHDIGQRKISMKLQLVDHGETETLPEHFKAVVTKCELSRTFNGDALLDIEIAELPVKISEPPVDVVPAESTTEKPVAFVTKSGFTTAPFPVDGASLDSQLAERPTEEKADPDIAAT